MAKVVAVTVTEENTAEDIGILGLSYLYIIWNYKIKRIWPEDIFTFTRMVTIFIPLTLN